MHRSKWTPVLLLMGLLAMESTAANAESRIGTATSTRPDAEGIVGTNSETLSPGSEVYADETVRTGNVGRADLVLLDNTSLSVGPASELTLDKFVYDKNGSAGSVVLQATRGTFQFVTGSQDHRAYQVNTPYGSLGDSESLANFVRDIPGDSSLRLELVPAYPTQRRIILAAQPMILVVAQRWKLWLSPKAKKGTYVQTDGHLSPGHDARPSAKHSFGWSRAKALASPAKRENVLTSIIQGTSCVSRRAETSCVRQVHNRYFPVRSLS